MDIGTIIIESEHSRYYKTPSRPFVDVRIFTMYLAQTSSSRLILGSAMPQITTLFSYKNKGVSAKQNPITHYPASIKTNIIDMKEGKKFKVLSKELEDTISQLENTDEHLFIFTSRRGIAPITLCNDCGESVLCTKCKTPIVLHGNHKESKHNTFVCHHCGSTRSAYEKCTNCTSWNLVPLGIGTERVEQALRLRSGQALRKLSTKLTVFRIDSDTTKTDKQARDIVKSWKSEKSSVLVGTERAISYINNVEHTAIASLDSLLAIPDFHINERVFRLLLELREKTQKTLLVQTRSPENTMLEQALSGNIEMFYKDEIKGRKLFNYPPFSTLIKITVADTKHISHLESEFGDYTTQIYSSPSRNATNMLITLKQNSWSDEALLSKLRNLPPHFTVDVNPKNL